MEYTRGIDSRFPVSELANKIKERGIKDKKTKKNAYQMEYSVSFYFGIIRFALLPQPCCNLIGYRRLFITNKKENTILINFLLCNYVTA